VVEAAAPPSTDTPVDTVVIVEAALVGVVVLVLGVGGVASSSSSFAARHPGSRLKCRDATRVSC
jgi:hypothetical protein